MSCDAERSAWPTARGPLESTAKEVLVDLIAACTQKVSYARRMPVV